MDASTLRIRARAAARLRKHLAAAYPNEACGLLLGRERGGRRLVERAVPAANAADDARTRYRIAPEAFLFAWRNARRRGLDVLGFYHSHPDHPARPSARDVREGWPFYAYVIARVNASGTGALRAFRLDPDARTATEDAVRILRA